MTNPNQQGIFVNEHIHLVPPDRRYSTKLYNIIDVNRDNFSQYMAWTKFVSNETDTSNFLDNCTIEHQIDLTKTYLILLDNNLVGLLSFNQIDKNNKTAYIGYWLDKRTEGKGIMTQAIQALTHHYASQKIIKRFVIKCSVDNPKSNAVAKRCGFSYEGTLKQAEYLNGIYHDQNIYGLISTYL
ncbi:50S ribosomal protein L7/L12-serine acetyltransferase [Gilliamella sp. B2776]|uniref:50S ribosomal protein L7/L12-serine acetyltransferase n=1 Tax=unclassified Gilliamella TaxID=2685620 RepID=UPI00226AFB61|nr:MULTISPECIES: 50S ribosomal protein L7/L12-serine acetyltransferase [unclassified Gilliamella]MCX8650538.1 50S ribosomal protein L7/L12-serine acetyltransferase [Gilliamella sp. B2779]MCX8653921.1 50S ribosomal protein L7/L12-serine acetyltransferase [Gilliamella sp. B2737]MCX8656892.1 50S ribosomal protein L7/L12-serine acetyltransferase [Gilliamella sp. B2894]MCX8665594.1 50S ribosomal protein L7/L12-serine acetyltransferase [Gilliamella sp. B2887]MCX8692386.1 50S ribosomal protein L7/L12